MSNIDLTPGVKSGGKGRIAFWTDTPFPICLNVPTYFFLRTYYGCDGRALNPRSRWRCYLGPEPGKGTVWVYGVGTITSGDTLGYGLLIDNRSIEMILGGCCPPQLLIAYLGTEGIPT